MPFIVPALPAIAKIGGSLLGSWLGGKLAGQSNAEKQAQQGISALAPYGKQLVQQGTAAYQPSLDYWTKILSGNRSAMMEPLGPEIGRIGAGYNQARQNLAQFAPMGGGRSALMGELPFRQAQDVSTLFSTIRPQAATMLPQIASSMVSGGTQAMYPLGNLLQYGLQNRQQQFGMGQQIGGGLMDIIGMIPGLGKKTGGGGGGGGGSTTGYPW